MELEFICPWHSPLIKRASRAALLCGDVTGQERCKIDDSQLLGGEAAPRQADEGKQLWQLTVGTGLLWFGIQKSIVSLNPVASQLFSSLPFSVLLHSLTRKKSYYIFFF